MKGTKFILVLLIGVIVTLSIVHVVVANSLSTAGVELDKIETNLEKVKKQNTLLHEQVLEQASLDHIASEAAQMGFVSPKSEVYFSAPLPMARR